MRQARLLDVIEGFPCCGCSCHVCADGHRGGYHTDECLDRFLDEMKKGENREHEHNGF
jgi:hypothetical protein